MRREDKEIAHLLGEIMRLVEEANELERDGESRQAAAVRRDLEALRWRLAGVVSHDATYRSAPDSRKDDMPTLTHSAVLRETRSQESAHLTLVPSTPLARVPAGGARVRTVVPLPGHPDVQQLLRSLHASGRRPAARQLRLERIRWQLALAVRRHLLDDGGVAA